MLKPNDAADVLEQVLEAQNQSVFFGLKLNIPLHIVEAIQSTHHQPKDRLLHVIIEFLKQVSPRPTWRVIINALRSPAVNLPQLANTVETAHFPDTTAIREVVPITPSTPTGTLLHLLILYNYNIHFTVTVSLPKELPQSPVTTRKRGKS